MHREVTGFVLAGGKSSRMGANKALLSLNGATLLERTAAMLEQICQRVMIVGPRALYGTFGECVEDVYPGCGPLAGIHVALLNSPTRHSLITAVDTPFISKRFLHYLVERALASSAIVTAPRIAGKVQPLCSVFARDFLPLAEEALKSGRYKVEPIFPPQHTLIISEGDLAGFEIEADMFENLNTPEDLERARKRSCSRHSS
jgi:molybdenum cofactor guanylyltransferase